MRHHFGPPQGAGISSGFWPCRVRRKTPQALAQTPETLGGSDVQMEMFPHRTHTVAASVVN